MNDAYGDLDRMMGGSEGASPESSATDVEESSVGNPSSSGKQEDKKVKPQDSSASDAAKGKPEAKPGEAPKAKPQPAAELRQAYEALKAKHKALEEENISLKTKPVEDPEKKTWMDRAEAAEKRRLELEDEMRYTRYESSAEYKQKYEEPFVNAYQTGRAKAASLKITDSDGNIRQGTQEDFDRIARLTDDDQAASLAADMFGNKAPLVLYHRERVQELNGARVRAIEDFKKIGAEREKQQNEAQTKSAAEMGKAWQQANAEAVERYPQWFKPTEGADDENAALEEGMKLADKAFSDTSDLSPEQRVRLHSAIRNRAAGFGRLVLQNRKLSAQVTELQTKLKEFENSEPGDGDGKGGKKTEIVDTLEGVVAGLDAMAR